MTFAGEYRLMKRAVSISIGSSKRDKAVSLTILGETVQLERIGTDGDLKAAARLFRELDGKVDALGVGGGLLGLMVGERWYPMHSLQPLVRDVRRTPVVDGTGLKMTLEWKAVLDVDRRLKDHIPQRTALVMTAVDRWGMARGARDAGYRCTYGDVLFSLGLPIPIHREATVRLLAAVIAPLICRLPFAWVYPIGKSQEKRKPSYTRFFEQAGVILGDCHYVWKYMSERLDGKTIITNTTTTQDVAFFKQSGARYLATTTPVYDGRSFGTNAMEAAIVAASGRKAPIDYAHPGDYFRWMESMIDELKLTAQIQELCP
jgi:hypothetical protein